MTYNEQYGTYIKACTILGCNVAICISNCKPTDSENKVLALLNQSYRERMLADNGKIEVKL